MDRTFWFEDVASGEEFFVECNTKAEALKIAETYFRRPKLIEEVSFEFAEMMGLDTY